MWDIESDKIFCNACTRDQEDGRIPSILPRLYKDHSHLQTHLVIPELIEICFLLPLKLRVPCMILFPCFNLHLKVSFQLNHVLIVLLLCLSFQRILLIQYIRILCFPLGLRVSIYLIRFKLVLLGLITLWYLCLSFQGTILLIQLSLILCFPLGLRVSIYLIRFKLVLIVFITLLCLLLFSWLLFQGFPLIIRFFPFKLDIYRNKIIL